MGLRDAPVRQSPLGLLRHGVSSAAGQPTATLSADVARLEVSEISLVSFQVSVTGMTVKPIDEERVVNTVLHTNRTLGAAEVKAELLFWSMGG